MSAEAPALDPDAVEGVPLPRETAVLFGQEEAERAFLATRAGGRLPHSWMITGPRGVGKATLAWRIARHLLADAPAETLAMDPGHRVFRQVAALSAPALFLCTRSWDDKAKRLRSAISVDEVRALKAFFQLSAAEGGWRVAIVDAADDLTNAAANALLKVLEEPPERAVLLLVCHQPALLVPTLRSRCRMLPCRPLGPQALVRALEAAGFEAGAQAPALVALADGSVGTAMRLQAEGGAALYGEILEVLCSPPASGNGRAITLAEACAGRGAEGRYDLTLFLIRAMLGRLARAGAGAEVAAVSAAEAEVWARLGRVPAQARVWAELAAELTARTGHARAVNLDPAQVILDSFLQIQASAARAGTLGD